MAIEDRKQWIKNGVIFIGVVVLMSVAGCLSADEKVAKAAKCHRSETHDCCIVRQTESAAFRPSSFLACKEPSAPKRVENGTAIMSAM